jgi:hypothetical protein
MPVQQVGQVGPKFMNMLAFLGSLDMGGSLTRGSRFAVSITPPAAIKSRALVPDLHMLCDTAELPGRSFSVAQARYYGPSQVFPTNTEYQPITLSFLCRSDSRERRFFDDWMDFINPVNNFNYSYPNEYFSEINIFQYSEYADPSPLGPLSVIPLTGATWTPHISYHWRLLRAWPLVVNAQPVNWAEQDVLRLQVTFTYKNWDRPTLLT